MRMFFEPEDEDGYAATCELLTGRLAAWSRAQGLAAEPVVVESALDYRHRGTVDGRLGLWQARHVEEFLLDWLPRMLTQLPGEPTADGPAGLRTLLSYLCAMGLDDPRGEPLDVLERAIDAVSPMFAEAMADRTRWGMAKFWATTAAEQGVDIFDQVAMERFTERARRGEVPYDEAALEAIARRHQVTGPPQMARAEPQLPVTLPAEDELRTTATAVPLIGQLAALAEWAGKDGRELTKLGRLKIADARELVATLRTGDRPGSPRSSADLPLLNLVFEWAKKARLVRPAKGRLYAVAKARPVLNDPLALWQRAFEALFELREALIGDRDGYRPTSMLYAVYEDILPDILNTLYSLPIPCPGPGCGNRPTWPTAPATVSAATTPRRSGCGSGQPTPTSTTSWTPWSGSASSLASRAWPTRSFSTCRPCRPRRRCLQGCRRSSPSSSAPRPPTPTHHSARRSCARNSPPARSS